MRKLYGARVDRIARIEHGTRPSTHFIVVHDAEADNIDGVGNYFRTSSPDAVGAHLGIGSALVFKPQVRQWADLDALVYHARGANSESVGIELAGYASQPRSTWVRRRGQRRALAQTLARLCHAYGLGVPTHKGADKNIKGHYEVPEGGHFDPGPNFPWDLVMPLAQKYYRKWYGR